MVTEQKKRLSLLDSIRGITIVNMVMYHALYNFFMIFGFNSNWIYYDHIKIWQRFICISFIFISGFSWGFSKNNLKRGIVISGFGILITLITFIFMPSEIIILGILSFIGGVTLIMIPLERIINKMNAKITFVCSIILFILLYNLSNLYIGIGNYELIKIPEGLADMKFFTIIGIPHPDFSSSDYFPLLPWVFIYIAGYSFQKIISKYYLYKKLFHIKIPLFDTIGRYSLQIYLLHQPLLMLICSLILQIIPNKG